MLTRGLRAYADLTGNKRASIVTTDDVMISAAGMLSVFIREPEFVGQTKDRLATVEAHPHRRDGHARSVRPLAGRQSAGSLEAARMGDRARRRARAPPPGEGDHAQDRGAQAAPARQARRLHAERRRRRRALHRRGRFRRRLGQAGARPRQPGGAAAARQDPQRRQRRPRQARRQPADRRPDPGARLRHAHQIPRRGSALRPRDHHDRRRRRRRAHRLAADHLLLPGDAAA